METIDLLTKDTSLTTQLDTAAAVVDSFAFRKFAGSTTFLGSKSAEARDPWDVISIQVFKNTNKSTVRSDCIRTFHSSGTSQTGILSSSHFTSLGLDHYRFGALRAFKTLVLNSLEIEASTLRAASIIPHANDRPSSSLSQMITWFSESFPVSFCGVDETVRDFVAKQNVTMLFSTGLQLVDLFEQGFRASPSQYQVIFETGGSKGTTLQAESFELHDMIRTMFGDDVIIVSEYGMCELASQAYAVNRYDDIGRPIYQFLPEISVAVADGFTLGHEGFGALTINDIYRSDVPFAIRTQDKVQLMRDGSFVLQGRLHKSPLKGCSLAFDRAKPVRSVSCGFSDPTFALAVGNNLSQEQLKSAFSSLIFRNALNNEVASDSLAELTLSNISIELNSVHFARAVHNLRSKATSTGMCPLILAPNNHALAVFHPLALLAGAGIACSLRLPFDSKVSATVSALVNSLRTLGARIQLLTNESRAEDFAGKLWFDRVLAFGSDATIENLRSVISVPLQGFGSVLACESIRDQNYSLQGITRRVIESRQRGCLNTRAIFVNDDSNFAKEFASALQNSISQSVSLSLDQHLELRDYWDHPARSWARNELNACIDNIRSPVFSADSLRTKSEHLHSLFADQPECFVPIFWGNESASSEIIDELRSSCDTVLMNGMDVTCNNTNPFQVPFAEPIWNGRHLNRELFAL